jgi:hypothetical protein
MICPYSLSPFNGYVDYVAGRGAVKLRVPVPGWPSSASYGPNWIQTIRALSSSTTSYCPRSRGLAITLISLNSFIYQYYLLLLHNFL